MQANGEEDRNPDSLNTKDPSHGEDLKSTAMSDNMENIFEGLGFSRDFQDL